MRTITANTTDDQILAAVHSAKKALVDFATECLGEDVMRGERLVALAQNVRTAEDLAHFQIQYRDICKAKPENRIFFLVNVVTRRDDTWSGRQNDSRRSSMDAICAWASDAASEIRHEG